MVHIKQSSLSQQKKDVVIRADCNRRIGSGHIVRCGAIADAVARRGGSVLFAVSDEESAASLRDDDIECVVLGGDCMEFHAHDGYMLKSLCCEVGASSVLVDSYGVTDEFFTAMRNGQGNVLKVVWIDDRYTNELGEQNLPVARDVDCVVNYSLGMDLLEYEEAYTGSDVKLCISPSYAPVRSQFFPFTAREYGSIDRIMVTTGSTNEDKILEQMTRACLDAVPNAVVDVIIGCMSEFDAFDDIRVVEHRNISDLAPFMRRSDVCICAAGTTLYELSAIGVPAIAVPIVDNQMPNAAGFMRLRLGLVVNKDVEMQEQLRAALDGLAQSPSRRRTYVSRMRSVIDGKGVERIAGIMYE